MNGRVVVSGFRMQGCALRGVRADPGDQRYHFLFYGFHSGVFVEACAGWHVAA